MSVVLLLSLAAFGLLVNHYQQQVMDEVGHTVSTVGQATLRTLESRWDGIHPPGTMAIHGNAKLQWSPESSDVEVFVGEEPPAGIEGMNGFTKIVMTRFGDESGPARHIEQIHRFRTSPDGEDVVTVAGGMLETGERGASDPFVAELEHRLDECLGNQGEAEQLQGFYINVDAVRAEPDPSEGLVLKIPRLTPTGDVDGENVVTFEFDATTDHKNTFFATQEDIKLPIPVGEYEQLFSTLRNRSLFLFLGVFLVGTVLSTGLASRFTRPIRRLDSGIRRVSAGDLDVEIPVKGRDEIARLSRAVNEMTRQLRTNRDRGRELVRREKLSALGRLAAGVAHDVRNPLHSIGLTLQHMQDTARPDDHERSDEFDRSLEIIRGEIQRLDGLVGNFLSFARSERREREAVDLVELANEIVRLVHKEAERRNVEIVVDTEPDVSPVLADGESLRSSMLNLVLNSFEAMPQGGRLTLTVRSSDGETLVEVADTGEGIPEEEQGHVFDFAYTTRDGGNGLGLAMVHHCIVEEHGGRVSLDSTPGEGTCVRMALPVGAKETQ
jgi:signal transduction histidine kinase